MKLTLTGMLAHFYPEYIDTTFVDSTPIRVCKNKSIKSKKAFSGIPDVGKSILGWFYGFKLLLIVNNKGEILSSVITQGEYW